MHIMVLLLAVGFICFLCIRRGLCHVYLMRLHSVSGALDCVSGTFACISDAFQFGKFQEELLRSYVLEFNHSLGIVAGTFH